MNKYLVLILFYDKLENYIQPDLNGFPREPGTIIYYPSVWNGKSYTPNTQLLEVPMGFKEAYITCPEWEGIAQYLAEWTNKGWDVIPYDKIL